MKNQTETIVAAVAKYRTACAAARDAFTTAMEKARNEYLKDCVDATEAPLDMAWPNVREEKTAVKHPLDNDPSFRNRLAITGHDKQT